MTPEMEIGNVEYTIDEVHRSKCPRCYTNVHLLSPEASAHPAMPWFYICWNCKLVFRAGVGLVRSST